MTLMTRMKLGERNNIHRCVAHHTILYFPLAILINYSANLNIYVEEQSLAKYTQNSSNVFWEIQGGATCHTTAEIRAFFNAQFQSRVISCTAKVKGLPYSPNLPYLLLVLCHDSLAPKKAVNYQWTKKGRCTHDSRADDPRHSGQYPQKCNAHKQAEGDHFESFLLYLKKLFWILFQVLASFFFYESYFLSFALILGVSREKSYCKDGNRVGKVGMARLYGCGYGCGRRCVRG